MVQSVRLENAAARPLAAISTTASPDRLGPAIIATLDKIWPVLRGQGVADGPGLQGARTMVRRQRARENRRQLGGHSDWEDDAAKRRTDIYFGLQPQAASAD